MVAEKTPELQRGVISLLAGLACGFAGFFPWLGILLGKARPKLIPLNEITADTSWVQLSMSRYALLAALIVFITGATFCGLALNVVKRQFLSPGWTIAGLIAADVGLAAKNFYDMVNALRLNPGVVTESTKFVATLIAWSVACLLFSLLVLYLLTKDSPGAKFSAMLIASVPISHWVSARMVLGLGQTYDLAPWMINTHRWLPGLIVALAIIWYFIRTKLHSGVWLGALIGLQLNAMICHGIQFANRAVLIAPGDVSVFLNDFLSGFWFFFFQIMEMCFIWLVVAILVAPFAQLAISRFTRNANH